MTNELAIAAPQTDTLATNMRWAKAMSTGSMLPKHYQNNPANLLIACEYADNLGVPRVQILTDIQVINGRPSMSANLMATLARKAGHRLRVQGDGTRAVATLIRVDDPDFEYRSEWDVDKAKKAKLWGNAGPWSQYPDAMLRSRAISEVIRMGAPEALGGLVYSVDEVRDIAPAPTRVTVADILGSAPAADAITATAEVIEDESMPRMITGPQLTKLNILLQEAGLNDRDEKLAYLTQQLDREIASSKDLTLGEASGLIEFLSTPDAEASA